MTKLLICVLKFCTFIQRKSMKAAITGVTGFIGGRLKLELEKLNSEIISLTREIMDRSIEELASLLEGSDIVINLAGAPIIARQTKAYKKEIYSSRVDLTRKLVSAINICTLPPKHLISASAIGIYSDSKVNTETFYEYSDSFMANVCHDWETAASEVRKDRTTLTIIRQGIVLDNAEGALPIMIKPFTLFVGGQISDGTQILSWIHIVDHLRAILFIIDNKKAGVYNLVSPGYISNSEFTKVLARKLNRPAIFTVPSFALKLIFGDGAKALISGQAVYPERLLEEGFKFQYGVLEEALDDLLSPSLNL